MNLDNIQTIQDILGNAFRIPYNTPLKTYWPSQSREYVLKLSNASALERHYYIQNNVIIIRTAEAAYVMPFARNIETILLERGFFIKSMYVPFVNGDYPIERIREFKRVFKECTK